MSQKRSDTYPQCEQFLECNSRSTSADETLWLKSLDSAVLLETSFLIRRFYFCNNSHDDSILNSKIGDEGISNFSINSTTFKI